MHARCCALTPTPDHAAMRCALLQLSSKAPKTAKKSAYQGCPGAYSEVASLKACPDFDPLPCEQFETAFQVRRRANCDSRRQMGTWVCMGASMATALVPLPSLCLLQCPSGLCERVGWVVSIMRWAMLQWHKTTPV